MSVMGPGDRPIQSGQAGGVRKGGAGRSLWLGRARAHVGEGICFPSETHTFVSRRPPSLGGWRGRLDWARTEPGAALQSQGASLRAQTHGRQEQWLVVQGEEVERPGSPFGS